MKPRSTREYTDAYVEASYLNSQIQGYKYTIPRMYLELDGRRYKCILFPKNVYL
jgi:hypothetical protein